jgi:hypothetical protein
MSNKLFTIGDTNRAAEELIDGNVSFDFLEFLGKVGPVPSRFVLKHESKLRSGAEPKQAPSNCKDGSQNSRG